MATKICGFTYDYSEFEGATREKIALTISYSMMCGIETYSQIIAQATAFMDGEDLDGARKLCREIMSVINDNKPAFFAAGRTISESPECVLELPDAAEAREVFAAAAYISATMR